ncbi:hypothetical protein OA409_01525 [Prochlorococcus sp. AH-716-M06]|nr:hypothetical protein [Prochlorococcus sp. AH-716-M06]
MGSGNSLEKVKINNLFKYDYVIAINNSVEYLIDNRINNIILYSNDVNRIFGLVKLIDKYKIRTILSPSSNVFPLKILFLSHNKNIKVILPNLTFKILYKKLFNFNFCIPSLEHITLTNINEYIKFIKNDKNKKLNANGPYSSFFTLIAYLVKFKVKEVNIGGFDFKGNYSKLLSNNNEKNDMYNKSHYEGSKFFLKEVFKLMKEINIACSVMR